MFSPFLFCYLQSDELLNDCIICNAMWRGGRTNVVIALSATTTNAIYTYTNATISFVTIWDTSVERKIHVNTVHGQYTTAIISIRAFQTKFPSDNRPTMFDLSRNCGMKEVETLSNNYYQTINCVNCTALLGKFN